MINKAPTVYSPDFISEDEKMTQTIYCVVQNTRKKVYTNKRPATTTESSTLFSKMMLSFQFKEYREQFRKLKLVRRKGKKKVQNFFHKSIKFSNDRLP